MSDTTGVPWRLRFARAVLHRWPLRRGADRLKRLLVGSDFTWSGVADFSFRHGRFVKTSLDPWPVGYRDLYLRGIIDDEELAVWTGILADGDVVIDGGANRGYWTLVASDRVGARGHVYAFEPVPGTRNALTANVSASERQNVTVVAAALSGNGGIVTLYVATDDLSGTQSSMAPYDGQHWDGRVECPAVALAEFCRERGVRPQWIKLDLEGAELQALRGAVALLDTDDPPVVGFEWNRQTAAGLGATPEEPMALVTGLGYTPYLASADGLVPFRERTDIVDWSPMVWCFRQGRMRDRAVAAGLLEATAPGAAEPRSAPESR